MMWGGGAAVAFGCRTVYANGQTPPPFHQWPSVGFMRTKRYFASGWLCAYALFCFCAPSPPPCALPEDPHYRPSRGGCGRWGSVSERGNMYDPNGRPQILCTRART